MDEFYIGYQPSAPAGIRRRVRLFVLLAVLLTVGGAALFAISQRGFANSAFEYGRLSQFSGTLTLRPFPVLVTDRSGDANVADSTFLLCAPGKFGANSLLLGQQAKHVRITGTLIHRAEGQMIEVQPGSLSNLPDTTAPQSPLKNLGQVTLTGEVVDTKCYLGVMNPGEGKVHRDCAARCLSGGIPAALVSSDLDGTSRLYLLLGDSGEPLPKADFQQSVARPVAITGQVFESQGLYYLSTSAANIENLP